MSRRRTQAGTKRSSDWPLASLLLARAACGSGLVFALTPGRLPSMNCAPAHSKAARTAARSRGASTLRPFSKSQTAISVRFARASSRITDQSSSPRGPHEIWA